MLKKSISKLQRDHLQAAKYTDAFVSLLKESPGPNDMMGPTLKKIIAEQFYRSLYGRVDGRSTYWLHNFNKVDVYVLEVLQTSWAKVINANTNANVQKDAFHV
jgi:hypothetical protein